jgi:hypothetical protein
MRNGDVLTLKNPVYLDEITEHDAGSKVALACPNHFFDANGDLHPNVKFVNVRAIECGSHFWIHVNQLEQ